MIHKLCITIAITMISAFAYGSDQCVWNSLNASPDNNSLLTLQQYQQEYDEVYWFNRDFEKFRHVLLHLVDNVGKLAKYCEAKEHGKEPDTSQLVNEVLPDVLMHALQFANAFNIDLGQKYEQRIESNKKRFSK